MVHEGICCICFVIDLVWVDCVRSVCDLQPVSSTLSIFQFLAHIFIAQEVLKP